MQYENNEHGAELLDVAIQSIREELVPPLPTELIHTPLCHLKRDSNLRGVRARLPVHRLAVAAALLLCLGLASSLLQSPQLLAQVQAAIHEAEYISFNLETRKGDEIIQRYHIYYSSREGVRAESATKLHIFNRPENAILEIDHSAKIARSRP